MASDEWHEYFEMFPEENPAIRKESKAVQKLREQVAKEQAALDVDIARIVAKHNKPPS